MSFGDVGDVYRSLQWESNLWNEVRTPWYRRNHTSTGQMLLALWYACWFQTCGTKTPAKVTNCTPAHWVALNKRPPENGILYPVAKAATNSWTNPGGQGRRGNLPQSALIRGSANDLHRRDDSEDASGFTESRQRAVDTP